MSAFAFGTLLASTATLVCCVLPAVLVSLGAGAVLVGLVSSFPQLVWLSEHKVGVFAVAGVLLAVSGVMIWRARSLPCPADPVAARAACGCAGSVRFCTESRWCRSAAGALFAFVL